MLASLVTPLFRPSPLPLHGHLATSPLHLKNNTRELVNFSQNIPHGGIPKGGDGRPLWDKDIFSEPADIEPDADRETRRVRRASLRPQPPVLSQLAVRNTTVGKALREYGLLLWNIKQQTAPRVGLARKIREECVAALGGPHSQRGKEFVRRCQLTRRFLNRLDKLQRNTLPCFRTMHSHFVRDEVEGLRLIAMDSLANGKDFNEATAAKLKRAVECRIQRSETNWLTFPFYWIWSQMWCRAE